MAVDMENSDKKLGQETSGRVGMATVLAEALAAGLSGNLGDDSEHICCRFEVARLPATGLCNSTHPMSGIALSCGGPTRPWARMLQTISFRSEAVDWWLLLRDTAAGRIGRVHCWGAGDHPPDDRADGLEQHPTAALVMCLAGVVRLEGHHDRVDLAPGDALVMRAGVWHRHAPLRKGAIAFLQAAVGGRSDFFLESSALRCAAAWPEQPSRNLLHTIAGALDEGERRQLVGELLLQQMRDPVSPLPTSHRADHPMLYALWRNLHRPDCVERVVAASGLSLAQASRVFKARWKSGIASTVRRERMALAKELLTDGVPIQVVAQRLGISSHSVFSRIYSQHWGHPPLHDCPRGRPLRTSDPRR